MRWLWTVLILASISFTIAGVELCEGVIHVRRQVRLRTPPDYLPNIDFAWRDAQITAADGATMKGWFLEPRAPTGKCAAVLHGIGDSRLGALVLRPHVPKAWILRPYPR